MYNRTVYINTHIHTHIYICGKAAPAEFARRIWASGTFSASGWGPTEFQLQRIRAPNLGVRHHFRLQAGGRPNFSFNEFERRISASGTFSASGWGPTEFQLQRIRAPNFGVRHIFGFRLVADRISASTNSSAEFRRQAHFRLQAGGRPNFSFSEFERRISASGTFSASGWGPTEFQLQRIRAPNFGVRHIFGFRLVADRIFSFNEFERRISASGTFSASGWGPTEFQLQRIRAPNFGVRHIFGFRLGADRISASTNSSAEFRRQAHFRLQAGGRPNFGFSEFERRLSASGTFSASGRI